MEQALFIYFFAWFSSLNLIILLLDQSWRRIMQKHLNFVHKRNGLKCTTCHILQELI